MRGSLKDYIFPIRPQIVYGGGGDSGGSNGGGYVSIADMFDGGGAGGSGDTYFSGSHEDYVAMGGTGAVAHSTDNDDDDGGGIGGYNSLIDMFDGGGAGGSGSEFYSGSHEDYLLTDAGQADQASDAAGITNYSAGTYENFTDMIDGGGPQNTGDTFEGPLSGISTGIGATPLGSGIEPTGIAGFINSGGIIGSVLNAVTGGGTVDAVGNVMDAATAGTAPISFLDDDDGADSGGADTGTGDTGTVDPDDQVPVVVAPTVEDLQLGVIETPEYIPSDPIVGGGVISDPQPVSTYSPSPFIANMQNFYDQTAQQNYMNSPFMPQQFTPPGMVPPNPPPELGPLPTPNPTPIDPPGFLTTMAMGEEEGGNNIFPAAAASQLGAPGPDPLPGMDRSLIDQKGGGAGAMPGQVLLPGMLPNAMVR